MNMLVAIAGSFLIAQAPIVPPVPGNNADLSALASAAQAAKSKAHACAGASCPRFDCAKAQALSQALDGARVALLQMQRALRSAASDELRHFQAVEAEYVRNVGDDAAMQKVLAYSRFLANLGKLTLDAASLVDGFQSLHDLNSALAGAELSKADVAILTAKGIDQPFELASGMVGAIDDVNTSVLGGQAMRGAFGTVATLKGAASDAFGAMTDFREKWKQYKSAVNAGASVTRRAGLWRSLRASGKSAGQLVGKLGLVVAQARQDEIEDRLAENGVAEHALDAAAYAGYTSYRRVLEREEAADHAYEIVASAFQRCYACAAHCKDTFGPRPVPAATGETYGAVLKELGSRMASLTAAITSAAAGLTISEGRAPTVQIASKGVELGSAVSLHYFVAECPATDGARIGLFDAAGELIVSFGKAKRDAEQTISFTAPTNAGAYSVRLESRNGALFASQTFEVAAKSEAAAEHSQGTPQAAGHGKTRAGHAPKQGAETSVLRPPAHRSRAADLRWIQQMQKEIGTKRDAMFAKYDYLAVKKYLGQKCTMAGLGWARQYCDVRATERLYVDWDIAKDFYQNAAEAIQNDIYALGWRDFTPAEIAYVQRGMNVWRTTESAVETAFDGEVEGIIDELRFRDRQNAAASDAERQAIQNELDTYSKARPPYNWYVVRKFSAFGGVSPWRHLAPAPVKPIPAPLRVVPRVHPSTGS